MPINAPIFGMLQARLDALSTRQMTIAENVANSTTPGFKARDVDMKAFSKLLESEGAKGAMGGTRLAVTHAGHISPTGTGGGLKTGLLSEIPDSETTMDGNTVVVEEQMLKMAETRTEYETAIGLYQKALGLVRMAGKAPT